MTIKVLRLATVVANAVTAASAADPESVTVAVAEITESWMAVASGEADASVADTFTAPGVVGIKTVYFFVPATVPAVALVAEAVVIDVTVTVSVKPTRNGLSESKPLAAAKSVTAAGTVGKLVESKVVKVITAFSPGA